MNNSLEQLRKSKEMNLQYYKLRFDPFKLTGTEGYLNYKMSGFGSSNGKKNGSSNNGGGCLIVILILIFFVLLKVCGG